MGFTRDERYSGEARWGAYQFVSIGSRSLEAFGPSQLSARPTQNVAQTAVEPSHPHLSRRFLHNIWRKNLA